MRIFGALALFILIFLNPLEAQEVVSLKPGRSQIILTKKMRFLRDPGAQLSIGDVIQKQGWLRSERDELMSRDNTSIYWIKFSLRNPGQKPMGFIHEVGYPKLDHLDLYIPQGDGRFTRKSSGELYARGRKEIQFRKALFKLRLEASESKTYYLRVNPGHSTLLIPLRIRSLEALQNYLLKDYLILGLMLGLIAVMGLYNFFIFLSTRDLAYFYFVLLVAAILLMILSLSGLGLHLLWPESRTWNNHLEYFYMPFMHSLSALFAIQYLELKRYAPRFYQIALGYLIFNVFYGIYSILYLPGVTPGLANRIMNLNSLSTVGLFFIIALRMFFLRHRTAYFYTIAWLFPGITFSYRLLVMFGVLPSQEFITSWGVPLAFSSMVTLFSFGLADRINSMQASLKTLNINLESTVQERTLDLRGALSKLKTKETELLKSNENLRDLDRMKSNFFANLSHEFRTPLTLILAPLESLLRDSPPKSAEDSRRIIKDAIHNSQALLRYINNLLDLSRLDAHKMPVNLKDFELVSVLARITANFSSIAGARNLQLEFRSHQDKMFVSLDRDKLEQVILNLVTNALKYSDSGVIMVTLAAGSQANELSISVKDQGPGIPAGQLEFIFERFQRLDSGAGLASRGTGIGLALSRELAQLLGGSLDVQSTVGVGSEFTLRLPFQVAGGEEQPSRSQGEGEGGNFLPSQSQLYISGFQQEPRPAANSPVQPRPGAADLEKVLIVEDHPDLRDYLSRILARRYQVSTAQNGLEALEKIDGDIPDLILSDLMMPQMDGFEFLQKVRARDDLKNTGFILLTAHGEFENRIQGLSRGADDYIHKPFNEEELLLRVESLARKKLQRDRAVLLEREQIYADMHDHLGSQLTDLSFIARKLAQGQDPSGKYILRLKEAVDSTIFILRNRLLNLEDHKLLSENFVSGLNLILLRRYSNAGRILKFKCSADAGVFLNQDAGDQVKNALFTVITESVTNDLKYGSGPCFWNFDVEGKQLVLRMNSGSTYDSQARTPGKGSSTIQERLSRIDGVMEKTLEDGKFAFVIRV